MNAPLLSIIIPNYNNASLLSRAAHSCLKSDWENIELVIVDDCSTDSSDLVIRNLSRNNSRVKQLLLRENRGPLYARIAGIRASTGAMIAFLDADDEIISSNLKAIVAKHISNKADITVAGYRRSLDSETFIPPSNTFLSDDELQNFFWATPFRYLWSKIYNRDIAESVLADLSKLSFRHNEDVLANYLIIYRNSELKVLCQPILMTTYHFNEESITQTKSFDNFLEGYEAIAWINDDLKANGHYHPEFSNYFFSKLFDLAKTYDSHLIHNRRFILAESAKHFSYTGNISRENKAWLFLIRNSTRALVLLAKMKRFYSKHMRSKNLYN